MFQVFSGEININYKCFAVFQSSNPFKALSVVMNFVPVVGRSISLRR